ncbi:NAD(P)-dependent dehydrogenase (short-subunit alcohol dehydrogenase family) [Angulomicrobium amanitiforme]|uniref:NAD(P)-dependent dehydrogenase (Short-subunit alcohol dehydrogenase family) n=1 Tax=Ancylobacter amanitiformis TaxID=217069 RepID=A0ABU0LMV4_9HYPH|nr:NAD(P)-dependent dehydrogenase (short-subunit alcohol dehydrogenase family) [Ancylobacter amanitiformis]
MRGLKDGIIVVTGAAQGIGKATVPRLRDEEATVLVADRNGEGAQAVAAEIILSRGHAEAFARDVSDRRQGLNFAAHVQGRYGHIDGLVNNAGVTCDGEGGLHRWPPLPDPCHRG